MDATTMIVIGIAACSVVATLLALIISAEESITEKKYSSDSTGVPTNEDYGRARRNWGVGKHMSEDKRMALFNGDEKDGREQK